MGLFVLHWCDRFFLHAAFVNMGICIRLFEALLFEYTKGNQKLQTFWPAVANRRGPILLQDNARPYTSQVILQKVTQLKIEVLPHPPNSPDSLPRITAFSRPSTCSCVRRCTPMRLRWKMPSRSLSNSVIPGFIVMQ